MKNFLEQVLLHKWHKHFVVGSGTMVVLLWLFSFTDLRKLEQVIVSLVILFIGCVLWEMLQERFYNANQKMQDMINDVWAGVFGGFLVSLIFLIFV